MSSFHLDPRARLHLDRRGAAVVGGMLVGGQPTRVLRLGGPAAAAVARWRTGAEVRDPEVHGARVRAVLAAGRTQPAGCHLHGAAEQRLARRLHDAGLGPDGL